MVVIKMGCHKKVVWMFRDVEGMWKMEIVCKKKEILLFGLLLTGLLLLFGLLF